MRDLEVARLIAPTHTNAQCFTWLGGILGGGMHTTRIPSVSRLGGMDYAAMEVLDELH